MNIRLLLAIALAGFGLLFAGCATAPPREPGDLCAIFDEHPRWRRAAKAARERWQVPEAVLLAVVYQESSFRAKARPRRRSFLGVIPLGRLSTAYGYGQVLDGTWDDYRKRNGKRRAKRDRFRDVADFIGWYAHEIERRTGVKSLDAFNFYLAYHEGPGGYTRRSFARKQWLIEAARKVEARARRYSRQHARCGGPAQF